MNLAWAIARMSRRAAEVAELEPSERALAMQREAEAIHEEDVEACRAMGRLGAEDVPDGATILTHCNAGALATGGYGTALGVIRAAHEAGKNVRVLASETRPYLQGARLTSWELAADGIEVEVITRLDVRALLPEGRDRLRRGRQRPRVRQRRRGEQDRHLHPRGARRRARRALHGRRAVEHRGPALRDRAQQVPIEQRSRDEVAKVGGTLLVADGIRCRHPAFDVTPARLVRATLHRARRGTALRRRAPGAAARPDLRDEIPPHPAVEGRISRM